MKLQLPISLLLASAMGCYTVEGVRSPRFGDVSDAKPRPAAPPGKPEAKVVQTETMITRSTTNRDLTDRVDTTEVSNDMSIVTDTKITPALTETQRLIADWPAESKLGAEILLAKYGQPTDASASKLVWKDQGKFSRITVSREATPHDFPKPHMDFMSHTVEHRIPSNKASAVMAFDGSVTLDRTKGEITARCDSEEHNILALNLAHDIIMGRIDTAAARKKMTDIVIAETTNTEPHRYSQELTVIGSAVSPDKDKPMIAGAPVRLDATVKTKGDPEEGEVLGLLIALDEGEVAAASVALKKDLPAEVLEYATMMRSEHGKHLQDTLNLGLASKITALETKATENFRAKAAEDLADLIPLEGKAFAKRYMETMIADHTQALALIDKKLMPVTTTEALKAHLTATRRHIEMHLEKAKSLGETFASN